MGLWANMSVTNMMFKIQAQKMELKDNQKKNVKALLYIQQTLDKTLFSRIMDDAKQA